MSDVDVRNFWEQAYMAGLAKGYELGREGATGNRLPEVRITWQGRQPVVHIARPSIALRSPGLILPQNHGAN